MGEECWWLERLCGGRFVNQTRSQSIKLTIKQSTKQIISHLTVRLAGAATSVVEDDEDEDEADVVRMELRPIPTWERETVDS